MTDIIIQNGVYAKARIKNQKFVMVLSPRTGKNGLYVTVEGSPLGYKNRKIRILLNSETDIQFINGDFTDGPTVSVETGVEVDTDEEIMVRMRKKFQILDGMTLATIEGNVRALIVTGPPGVGKSFNVERIIESVDVMAKLGLHPGANPEGKLGVEKIATASPIGLYQLLYEYSTVGSVLVLDDSDTILYDETMLNMLKAATDSGSKRKLTWRTESNVLEKADIPCDFEFKGAIIFITNLDFEKSRGKIGEHLKAIVSRCHYLDMGIHGTREKFLRCKQIMRDGMLDDYKFEPFQEVAILDYIFDHQDDLRELSLRCVKKVADLMKMDPTGWKDYANETLLKAK